MPDIVHQCPCGETPLTLDLQYNGQGVKWASATCSACGYWSIEFKTQYHELATVEAHRLAIDAWNDAPRAWVNGVSPGA